MILHRGERVFWGAPEVIYLEGTITRLDEKTQTAIVHIDRATPHSAHLIGADIPFAAEGLVPLTGTSPAGTTTERSTQPQTAHPLSDDEKIRGAAIAAVHQRYGFSLQKEQEQALIEQVSVAINGDPDMRARIIASMDEILNREQS